LKGKIDQNALIVSPSPGLPIEWANPLSIEFPEIQYLDMGWLTFSPAYEQVLREFDIQSVPAALYEKGNVYLMEKPLMAKSILRFIRENEGVRVRARVIYALPGNIHAIDPYYDQVKLYKLTQVKAGPGQ
jgi:hypothetical protein